MNQTQSHPDEKASVSGGRKPEFVRSGGQDVLLCAVLLVKARAAVSKMRQLLHRQNISRNCAKKGAFPRTNEACCAFRGKGRRNALHVRMHPTRTRTPSKQHIFLTPNTAEPSSKSLVSPATRLGGVGLDLSTSCTTWRDRPRTAKKHCNAPLVTTDSDSVPFSSLLSYHHHPPTSSSSLPSSTPSRT